VLGDTTTREGAGVEADGATASGFGPESGFGFGFGFGEVQDINANIIRKPALRALTRTGYVLEALREGFRLPPTIGLTVGCTLIGR
jgi:hypothetical protein